MLMGMKETEEWMIETGLKVVALTIDNFVMLVF